MIWVKMINKVDCFGKEINIDDLVLYHSKDSKNLQIGKVSKITSIQVYVIGECTYYSGWKYPKNIQIITIDQFNAFKERDKLN